MGIGNYHTWLIKNFRDCYSSNAGANMYDYIYIDMNYILHNSMHRCRTPKQFFHKVFDNLNYIFYNYAARKEVIFAIDGPSPYAKVVLQRQRRSQSARKTDFDKINSLHLTPGTDLLDSLEKELKLYVKKLFKRNRFLSPKYKILSSREPNEGEVKMFNQLIQFGKQDADTTHLVVGNDADLVAMAMAAQPINHIYMCVKQGIIDIDQMMRKILGISNLVTINSRHVRQDMAIISIMGGNDYIPKMGYVTLDKLYSTYLKFRKLGQGSITSTEGFNTANLITYLGMLNQKVSSGYRLLKLVRYNEDQVRDYLRGLLWCLEMYRTGVCPMYDYAYSSSGVVLPVNVKYYLQFHGSPQIPRSDRLPLSSELYTLITMPKAAKSIIPDQYHSLLDNELSDLFEAEECDQCIGYRGQMSTLFKELKRARDFDEDSEETRKSIGQVTKSYNAHKKTHRKPFNINDLERILALTETDTEIS